MVLNNVWYIVEVAHQRGALRRNPLSRRRVVGESEGRLYRVPPSLTDVHQPELSFQDLHIAAPSSPGRSQDSRNTEQRGLGAHARALACEQTSKGQDMMHTVHTHPRHKRL